MKSGNKQRESGSPSAHCLFKSPHGRCAGKAEDLYPEVGLRLSAAAEKTRSVRVTARDCAAQNRSGCIVRPELFERAGAPIRSGRQSMPERNEKSADSLRKRGGAGARQGCVNPLPLTGHSLAPLVAMQVVHALIRRCCHVCSLPCSDRAARHERRCAR